MVNRTTGYVLTEQARIASGPWAQLVGWMGRAVPAAVALGLPHCPRVHTFFVRAPLDVAFCDDAGCVLRLVPALRPFALSPWVGGTAMAWETRAGRLAPFVAAGDVLGLELIACA